MYEPPSRKQIGRAVELLAELILQCEYKDTRDRYRKHILELLEPRFSEHPETGVARQLRMTARNIRDGEPVDVGEDPDLLTEIVEVLGDPI